MNKSTLKIEYVRTEILKEYENNAKLHPQEQIDQIKKSITEFGMNDPIAICKDNIIIEGHGRLIACEQINRICYMMEYDPKYVDVIIKRWEDFTGNKAVKYER